PTGNSTKHIRYAETAQEVRLSCHCQQARYFPKIRST
ncbi:unnamed protein product, partial [Callosobruchus maculatus]